MVKDDPKVLQARIQWLESELKKARARLIRIQARAEPTQELIPGLPAPTTKPRELSIQEDYYRYFVEKRAAKFSSIGTPFEADEEQPPAFIQVAFKRIDSECGDSDVVCDLINAYLDEVYPANYSPPWPFRAFASNKVWPKLLKQMREAA